MTMRRLMRGACTAGIGFVLLSFSLSCEPAQEPTSNESPEGAMVYIISPIDGAVVSETFIVRFGLRGMGVAPAGADVANTGHHHLLVDLNWRTRRPVSLQRLQLRVYQLHNMSPDRHRLYNIHQYLN